MSQVLARHHRLAALADDLRRAGFFRLGRLVESIPSMGAVGEVVIPSGMLEVLDRKAPELARALRDDLSRRGIAIRS